MGCFVVVVIVFNFCSSAEVVFEKYLQRKKKTVIYQTVPETGEYFRSLQGGKGVKNLKVYQMNN